MKLPFDSFDRKCEIGSVVNGELMGVVSLKTISLNRRFVQVGRLCNCFMSLQSDNRKGGQILKIYRRQATGARAKKW